MTVAGSTRVVLATGTARQRGKVQGEQLRDSIRAAVERWRDDLSNATGRPADEYLAEFLRDTEFRTAVRRWVPDLEDEIGGIAEGSGLREETIWAYQLMDEEWAYRREFLATRPDAARRDAESCTSIGLSPTADRPTTLAQNMDLPRTYDGSQVVVMHRPGTLPDMLVLTAAGMVGLTGLNARGVGVCVNALGQLKRSGTGLPVAFVIRLLLRQLSLSDAAFTLRSVRHASGQNYLLGGLEGVLDFECSGDHVIPVPASSGAVFHTNHPLVSNDYRRWPPLPMAPSAGENRDLGSDSVLRLNLVRTAVGQAPTSASSATLRRVLEDRSVPICRSRGDPRVTDVTIGSVVMELGDSSTIDIALGPPADTRYARFGFAPN